MRPLIWVLKSMDKLAETLTAMGHPISADTVRKELVKLGFSRQFNRKADEGSKHPDRNAQFEHINTKVVAAQAAGQPVISVDTKKKELVGNYKNGGSDYRPKGDPQRVNVHDFVDKELGKAVPYGIYDVAANAGFVSVGITSDTAEFAVEAIRGWLERMGRQRYPKARELTITADSGGSNGARVRLWKVELQKLADETGSAPVHHYPPGTSKWNKIEHRMFCHITQNWRGRPLYLSHFARRGSWLRENATEHHLIVAHEVTNEGHNRAQLANMAGKAKEALGVEKLEAIADRGCFDSQEILACEQSGVTVTLPKPMTSGAKSEGRFGKQDFVYCAGRDIYRCPAGQELSHRSTSTEDGKVLKRYWTSVCGECALKPQCTTGPQRRVTRWEHEHVLKAAQERLDKNPEAMRVRRETAEHPFGTMKARMGTTPLLMKTLPKVATEMALSVLAYNFTRVMNILGAKPLMAAIAA